MSEQRPRRVLIVDDSPLVATSTARLLELEGWQVEVAHDGRAALARAEADPLTLGAVLLDLVLPDLDGGEVFQRLRRLRQDLPVVLTSGYGEQSPVGSLLGPGAVFLAKPFALEELLAALRRAGADGPA